MSRDCRTAFHRLASPYLFVFLLISDPWNHAHASGVGAGDAASLTLAVHEMQIRIEDERLSLQARNATLSAVLRAVAVEAGFRLSLGRNVEEPITRRLASRPLDRALRDLLRGHDFAMVYDPSRPGAISELHVFGPSICPAADLLLIESPAPPETEYERAATEERGERLRGIVNLGGDDPDTALRELSATLLAADDVLLRRAAVLELARLDSQAIPVLAQALRDAEPSVRRDALRAIARIGGEGAMQPLREGLNDVEATIRLRAVRAFASLASNDEAGPLQELLSNDNSSTVRREALLALVARSGPLSRDALAVASQDPDPMIRAAALGILAGWN